MEHELLEQQCNLHLVYIGNVNYAQLTLQTVTTQYEIFGVPNPLEVQVLDTKPEIIGTLTADENATLDTLLKTGLEKKAKSVLSASAGSSRDLERVKTELADSSTPAQTSLSKPKSSLCYVLVG